VAATLFFGCTLGLAFLSNSRPAATTTDSVLDRAAVVAPAPAASGAAAIPGAVVAPAVSASAAASGAAQ
jgi:preprotein translocase subunit SecG